KDPSDIVRELKRRLGDERAAALAASGVTPADLGLIGESEAIRHVAATIDRIKDVDSTVLVTGESGTGKELVARAIHNVSIRSGRRFEAINCGAIPATLLESELFGHKRGAFTDAKVERKGIFETVSGGTLLL